MSFFTVVILSVIIFQFYTALLILEVKSVKFKFTLSVCRFTLKGLLSKHCGQTTILSRSEPSVHGPPPSNSKHSLTLVNHPSPKSVPFLQSPCLKGFVVAKNVLPAIFLLRVYYPPLLDISCCNIPLSKTSLESCPDVGGSSSFISQIIVTVNPREWRTSSVCCHFILHLSLRRLNPSLFLHSFLLSRSSGRGRLYHL